MLCNECQYVCFLSLMSSLCLCLLIHLIILKNIYNSENVICSFYLVFFYFIFSCQLAKLPVP